MKISLGAPHPFTDCRSVFWSRSYCSAWSWRSLTRAAVESDQDNRLLAQRANEVSLVLGTSISSLESTLTGLGHVARDGGTALFIKEAADDVVAGPGNLTFALLRPSHGSYVVTVEAGHGLSVGEVVPGPVATVLAAAQKGGDLVATPGTRLGRQSGAGVCARRAFCTAGNGPVPPERTRPSEGASRGGHGAV